MVNALTLIASASLLAPFVHAYGMIGQVVDANNFCVFLPPKNEKNRNIADTEWEGQAFCLGNTPKATKAGKLNSDFIKSAHYLATDKFVQVTGQMDPSKENLDPKDDGGQFDVKAPKGSSCAGWKFYVNLIEPVTKTYCMRCCVSYTKIYINYRGTNTPIDFNRMIAEPVTVVFLKKVVSILFLEITVVLMVVPVMVTLMTVKLLLV